MVSALLRNGIQTYESCQSGQGHVYTQPAVRFHGSYCDGLKALGIMLDCGFRVMELRRVWSMVDNELHGPTWELTFHLPNTMEANTAPAL